MIYDARKVIELAEKNRGTFGRGKKFNSKRLRNCGSPFRKKDTEQIDDVLIVELKDE